MTGPLHQKGANGLLAEYQCAAHLNHLLTKSGWLTTTSQSDLQAGLDLALVRVANELSPPQVQRAMNQGTALAEYIADALTTDPSTLGLRNWQPSALKRLSVRIEGVGHNTNSGSSADLQLAFDGGTSVRLPISLKAYRGSVSSLGSKSARASLTKLFIGADRVPDPDFVSFFGEPGQHFLDALRDFQAVAKDFYASDEGTAFIDRYEARKGSRKVNNPLRRKEVGDYYLQVRGAKSEHVFAKQYVEMFNYGMEHIAKASPERWLQFLQSLKFVLGMDEDILTLNAVAGDDGHVIRVDNSYVSDAYATIRKVLAPGCNVVLTHRPNSSIIGVELLHDGARVRCLNLAIWKDATIQFKLDSRIVS